ncbi:MAG: arylsulfatase [Balneolaceae bacterium]|nr:arylsulfatase [Balneolaceae bacterium]MDR9408413.1 arylsulfatase [Balneolaceae bacterium]
MKNIFTCLLLIFVHSGGFSQLSAQDRSPNIVYILADDLGYGDLGSYGQAKIKTPHLDQMAEEGMRFTQHYAGNTVCAPSRVSLLTGKHPGNASMNGNGQGPIPDSDFTIAELLKSIGYETAVIGKWGLGDPGSPGVPSNQGFDVFYGFLNHIRAHNYWPDYIWSNQGRVELPNEVVIVQEGYAKGIGSYANKKEVYVHDRFTEHALNFIGQERDTPFFLYLPYTIPHANNERQPNGMEVPSDEPYSVKDWPQIEKNKAAMITRMDKDIGRLLNKLKSLGLDQNTVVFFTSDNGPHQEGGVDPDFFDSNGPLRGIKRDLYEGGIRVPMIAWAPGLIPAGTESDHISAFWDMYPTIAELTGASFDHHIDGISMVPTLLGETENQENHEYLYWEFDFWDGFRKAVRKGKWKAVQYNNQENSNANIELFNLEIDRAEQNNISDDHPDVLNMMQEIINKESD